MVSSGGGGGPPLQEQSPAISPFVGGTLHYFTTLLWATHHTTLQHFCGRHTAILYHTTGIYTTQYSPRVLDTSVLWGPQHNLTIV